MSDIKVKLADGTIATTCKPSMGYSFAAGTTDGPGAFDFVQSETTSNPFWEFIRNFLHKPSQELRDCHAPKPVLLPTGELEHPYPWDPTVLPLQILQIGRQLTIISVPSEFTTMSGRRMRGAIREILVAGGVLDGADGMVVIAGLANDYSSYVTTFEEYQVQRYEGASTLFGPHTLEAYIQEMSDLARSLTGELPEVDPGTAPDDLLDKQISLLPNALPDVVAIGAKFGGVLKDVSRSVYDLADRPVISASFHSANPRHDLRLEDTFLAVERLAEDNTWERVATDADVDTRFLWSRRVLLSSTATVEWRPADSLRALPSGTYRLVHFGVRKLITGKLAAFKGRSRSFQLRTKAADPASWASLATSRLLA